MKKILMCNIAIIALIAFATMAPPIDAKASGFYNPLDLSQIVGYPYEGDITNDLVVGSIEKYCTVKPVTGDGGGGFTTDNFGTTAVLSAKAQVVKGGGLFGASTAWRPII